MNPQDMSWKGWRSNRSTRGVRNEGLITQKREFDVHSHSFQDEELKLHSNVDDVLLETGCGGVEDSTVPPEGSEIKG